MSDYDYGPDGDASTPGFWSRDEEKPMSDERDEVCACGKLRDQHTPEAGCVELFTREDKASAQVDEATGLSEREWFLASVANLYDSAIARQLAAAREENVRWLNELRVADNERAAEKTRADAAEQRALRADAQAGAEVIRRLALVKAATKLTDLLDDLRDEEANTALDELRTVIEATP